MAISKLNPVEGGIPFGDTSDRPANPVIGTVYYNGQLEILEIYNGTEWVANSAPPATPTIVSVTDVGTDLAYTSGGSINFVVAPGTGGGTPSQYTIFTETGGFSTTTNNTTGTLTGLTSNTSFNVIARAQNNFGTTVNSPSLSITPTTKPQVPTIGTATTNSVSASITVNWILGNNGGKSLSAITITPYLNGTTAQTPVTAATTSSTSYTFEPGTLNVNSSYTFKVKTTNANGDSPESSASNSVTMPAPRVDVTYLVVAGGGGGAGGNNSSEGVSGGGAGGYRTDTLTALDVNTNYPVTIGAGSAGVGEAAAGQGSDSIFSTITSAGGGGGRGNSVSTGGTGGSGGGGARAGGAGVASPAGQGNAGGSSNAATNAGGGGGAGAAGQSATNANQAGNGGNGLASSITGTSVTYAGGGGAATGTQQGIGGTGGGGNGFTNTDTSNPYSNANGTANRGGGGGGHQSSLSGSGTMIGGSGGSGIVILRYLSDFTINIGAGLTGSTATDGSYKVTTITAGSGNVSWSI